jgi:hypothetical protein
MCPETSPRGSRTNDAFRRRSRRRCRPGTAARSRRVRHRGHFPILGLVLRLICPGAHRLFASVRGVRFCGREADQPRRFLGQRRHEAPITLRPGTGVLAVLLSMPLLSLHHNTCPFWPSILERISGGAAPRGAARSGGGAPDRIVRPCEERSCRAYTFVNALTRNGPKRGRIVRSRLGDRRETLHAMGDLVGAAFYRAVAEDGAIVPRTVIRPTHGQRGPAGAAWVGPRPAPSRPASKHRPSRVEIPRLG